MIEALTTYTNENVGTVKFTSQRSFNNWFLFTVKHSKALNIKSIKIKYEQIEPGDVVEVIKGGDVLNYHPNRYWQIGEKMIVNEIIVSAVGATLLFDFVGHGINIKDVKLIQKKSIPKKENMKTENNLVPFNYDEAVKNPEMVRYANGEKPVRVIFVPEANGRGKIITIPGKGDIECHCVDGQVLSNGEFVSPSFDLRLEVQEMIVCLFKNSNGNPFCTEIFSSVEKAKDHPDRLEKLDKLNCQFQGFYKLVKVEEGK